SRPRGPRGFCAGGGCAVCGCFLPTTRSLPGGGGAADVPDLGPRVAAGGSAATQGVNPLFQIPRETEARSTAAANLRFGERMACALPTSLAADLTTAFVPPGCRPHDSTRFAVPQIVPVALQFGKLKRRRYRLLRSWPRRDDSTRKR